MITDQFLSEKGTGRFERRSIKTGVNEAFPVIISHEDRSNAPCSLSDLYASFRGSNVGWSRRHRY